MVHVENYAPFAAASVKKMCEEEEFILEQRSNLITDLRSASVFESLEFPLLWNQTNTAVSLIVPESNLFKEITLILMNRHVVIDPTHKSVMETGTALLGGGLGFRMFFLICVANFL